MKAEEYIINEGRLLHKFGGRQKIKKKFETELNKDKEKLLTYLWNEQDKWVNKLLDHYGTVRMLTGGKLKSLIEKIIK